MNTIKASEIEGVIPEGATHWDGHSGLFFKKFGKSWFSNEKKPWFGPVDVEDDDDLLKIIYDTEFVPEVGMECEVSWGNHSTWYRCIQLDNKWFSWKYTGADYSTNPWTHREIMNDTLFRPIKSEEDKQREAWHSAWKDQGLETSDDTLSAEYSIGTFIEFLIKAGVKLPEGEQ